MGKPFKGVGSGVIEIALSIATPRQDVDLIKQRYKEAQELEKDEQKR